MPYRGLFYLVTQSEGSNPRIDPYASEHRCLPNRTHGIRYASAPRRSSCIRTYNPSPSVRPVSPEPNPPGQPSLSGIAPMRVLVAVFVMIVVAAVSSLGGIFVAHAFTGFVDENVMPIVAGNEDAAAAEVMSTPKSSWKQGETPVLYQADPEWADRPYGSGTIGTAGSAPLCLSMVGITATGNTASGPVDVASFAQNNGYADDDGALLVDGAQELGLTARSVEASELAIRREVVAGRPVIAALSGGAFGASTAYVVLADIDEHGMLIVHDPQSRERSSRHWSFEDVIAHAGGMTSYTVAP